jgi:amino-acid N-acetyltransferase
MTAETRNCDCLELRSARSADLQEVIALLGRVHLPTTGVAESLAHFIVAEREGELIGVAGLEVYGASALLRSVAVEDSWRGEHYFPRFGFSCVNRDSVNPGVKASIEFQEACPASATVMRKILRG